MNQTSHKFHNFVQFLKDRQYHKSQNMNTNNGTYEREQNLHNYEKNRGKKEAN